VDEGKVEVLDSLRKDPRDYSSMILMLQR